MSVTPGSSPGSTTKQFLTIKNLLMADKTPVYWEQKDGTLINVDDMTLEHLRNTLKMLIRNDLIGNGKEENEEDENQIEGYDPQYGWQDFPF